MTNRAPSLTTRDTSKRESKIPLVPLGQIAAVKLGKMLDRSKHKSGRKLPYLRNINVRWGTIDTSDLTEMFFKDATEEDKYSVRPGDVLVCEGGEPGRASVWAGGETELKYQKALHRVRFHGPYEPKLLVYFLEWMASTGRLEEFFTGSTIKHFTRESFVGLPVPNPPLPEQRRIVARIEELFSRLDAGVAALRHAKAQLQRYRQSVLAAAVTGQLTQAWREQHPDTESGEDLLKRILVRRREKWNGRGKYTEPVDHDSSDLKELPESWTWSSFEGVLTELRNGISKKPDANEGLRILRISAVRPLAVDLDDSRLLSGSLSKFPTYELEPNDLLFTRYNGTRAFVGVCGLVPKLPEPFVYPDKLIRARLVDQNALLPSFVEIAMNAGESRRFLEERVRTTAGQSGISGGDIKVAPLPIPPLAEQHQIVAEVEARTTAIDHLEAELDRQIIRSKRLRQSTLATAFQGGLLDMDGELARS